MISWESALQISRRKICELRPEMQKKVRAWFNDCLKEGLLPYVYEGQRSCTRQRELYARGRKVPGRIVTNAQAGQSMHQYGEAIDFVPLKAHEKALGYYVAAWDDRDLYDECHDLAARHGLRRLSWETPHLENADFKNWKEAREKYGNPCK